MTVTGERYADFIAAQLKDEYERHDYLVDAATSMVTRATGLIAIVVAALTFLSGKSFSASTAVRISALIAIAALLASALCAVFASLGYRFLVASTNTLRVMATSHWDDAEVKALHATAHCNLKTIETLRPNTKRKARILLISSAFQACAVAALAVCAACVISNW